MENKKEEIMELLEGLSDSDTLDMWNEYCENNGYYGDMVHYMSEFDDYFAGTMTLSALQEIFRQDFDPFCDYFRMDCGSIEECFDDIFEVVDLGTLADYIIDNDESFGNWEIEELLEEDEEEDEEEEDEEDDDEE